MLQRFLQSKWITVAGLLVLALLVLGSIRRQPASDALQREEDRIKSKTAELREQREEFEDKKAFLQSQAFLEREARLKLNYKKPGEEVVFVYHTAEDSESEVTPLAKSASNLSLWLNYLLGN